MNEIDDHWKKAFEKKGLHYFMDQLENPKKSTFFFNEFFNNFFLTSKKIIDNSLFTILGSCNKKKSDNCMITGIGQKINISSEGWDPFNKQ